MLKKKVKKHRFIIEILDMLIENPRMLVKISVCYRHLQRHTFKTIDKSLNNRNEVISNCISSYDTIYSHIF